MAVSPEEEMSDCRKASLQYLEIQPTSRTSLQLASEFPVNNNMVSVQSERDGQRATIMEEQNSGTISRGFFGLISHGIIDLCSILRPSPSTMSLLDFRYLQLGLCRFETTRPFLIFPFPVDCLHGA
jgi:hypothetical protein